MVEPLLSMTVSPTMITASNKRNVIPALTEVTVDCRLLPGQTQEEAERTIRAQLGDGDYEIVWREGQGGTRSALETPLWDAAESFIAEAEPGARVAPICVAGFTDSHWLRDAFGAVAYGFFPVKKMRPGAGRAPRALGRRARRGGRPRARCALAAPRGARDRLLAGAMFAS